MGSTRNLESEEGKRMKKGLMITPMRSAAAVSMLAGVMIFAGSAHAESWETGAVKWTVDGEVSQGFSWRAESRNQKLIGWQGGGTGGPGKNVQDDGNLNFGRGDLVSAPTSLLGTIEAEYENMRVLLRGSYIYDYRIERNDLYTYTQVAPYANFSVLPPVFGNQTVREHMGQAQQDALSNRFRLLDAYWSGDFQTGDNSKLELKLGKQTIAWGEAKFLGGGINMFNTLDFNRLRQPGATLKDGMLPLGAAEATFRANNILTLQGFYQMQRAKYQFDPVGTFFSDSDIVGLGAGPFEALPADLPAGLAPTVVTRRANDAPKKNGQYGLAAFLNLPDEGWGFGFYYQNLHARAQKVDGYGFAVPNPGFGPPLLPAQQYQWAYPEDIKTFGVSFNTNAGSAGLWGEVTYRQDYPVGLNPEGVAIARANAALCAAFTPLGPKCGINMLVPGLPFPINPLQYSADATGYVKGYTRVSQAAFNLGANWTLTGSDMLPSLLSAGGGSFFLEGMVIRTDLPDQKITPTAVTDKWHSTVIAVGALNYYRVGGSEWTITPKLQAQVWLLGDNVDQSPFFKGRLQVQPAIQVHHESAPDISFELSYTNISDHSARGDRVLSDRDYISASAKYTF